MRLRLRADAHLVARIRWQRAAVLSANEGVALMASLIIRLAAPSVATSEVRVAGLAVLLADALSMEVGKCNLVSSRSGTEKVCRPPRFCALLCSPRSAHEREALTCLDGAALETLVG